MEPPSQIRTAFALQDLRVLVTGACSGIGLEIARAYADAGCVVWVCDANPDAVQKCMEREATLMAQTGMTRYPTCDSNCSTDDGGKISNRTTPMPSPDKNEMAKTTSSYSNLTNRLSNRSTSINSNASGTNSPVNNLIFNPLAGASVCDISSEDSILKLFEEIKESPTMQGQLHILVNNAGVAGPTKAVHEIEVKDWDFCVGVNMKGTFMMSKYGIQMMHDTMKRCYESQHRLSRSGSVQTGTNIVGDSIQVQTISGQKPIAQTVHLNATSAYQTQAPILGSPNTVEDHVISPLESGSDMELSETATNRENDNVPTIPLSSKLPIVGSAYSIVNIASTAGLYGYPNRAPYCAAKWAVIGFTKTIAIEQGVTDNHDKEPWRRPIRCNAICPGTIENARMSGVIARDALYKQKSEEEIARVYKNQTSLRCFVQESDIANMALFFTSPTLAGRITGQVQSVCAGEKMP